MRTLTAIAAACLFAAPCLAQETTTATTPAPAPAGKAETTGSVDRPAPGANSFTEGQARARAEAAGFVGIQSLTKDDQGIWRGQATRDGKTVTVAVDFQGEVTTN